SGCPHKCKSTDILLMPLSGSNGGAAIANAKPGLDVEPLLATGVVDEEFKVDLDGLPRFQASSPRTPLILIS
ncbi:hypothetical protein PSY31_23985, partial [Shigella flexneri]|nr:hypothetical protein [Shigella flexneri]